MSNSIVKVIHGLINSVLFLDPVYQVYCRLIFVYLIHTGQYVFCKSPFHLCWQFFHNHDMLMLQMESPSLLNAQYSRVPTGSKTFEER